MLIAFKEAVPVRNASPFRRTAIAARLQASAFESVEWVQSLTFEFVIQQPSPAIIRHCWFIPQNLNVFLTLIVL
jgi:hypothetical protein